MEQELKLTGDYLNRGNYAMTLLKIIADYAPKTPYEIMDEEDEDLGEINEGEIEYADYDFDKHEWKANVFKAQSGSSSFTTSSTQESRDEPNFTNKLNHLDNEAFVMAISGSWGSGKTKFVENMFELLQGKGYERQEGTEADQFIQKNKYDSSQVAYFDAWKNDFYKDPIIPFSEMVLRTLRLKKEDYKTATNTIMDIYKKMLDDKNQAFGKYSEKDENKDNIDKLKKILRDSVREKKPSKVVIIVDELDRCKPTFAIQLLEVVKHLFNVKGIVFIFALDINQLQHCVKTVYGKDFDAIGYLERFFDYYSLLPKGSDELLFSKFAEEYGIQDGVNDYYLMCKQFNLTPREMKGVCSSFYYLNKYQLKDHPVKAKQLCFYLLLLKHRHPEKIHALSSADIETRKEFFKDKMPECLKASSSVTKQPFQSALEENKKIKETEFQYMTKDGECGEAKKYDFNNPIQDEGSLSFIIYAQDYHKDIGDKHILEYLFEKVETYGEAIPMEIKAEKIQRGKKLTFGKWHKNSPDDMEPIEWIVLDRQDNKALIITKYIIEAKKYNEEFVETNWGKCTLREWLNGEFYEMAFNEDEKKAIEKYTVKTEKNPVYGTDPGEPSVDSVFLLSMEEAGRYFENKEKRICKPTEYARQKQEENYKKWYKENVEEMDEKEKNKFYTIEEYSSVLKSTARWWLRSPGLSSYYAAVVFDDGDINAYGFGVFDDDVGLRPALWLILNP